MSGIGLIIDRTGRNRVTADFTHQMSSFFDHRGIKRTGEWQSADQSIGFSATQLPVTGGAQAQDAVFWDDDHRIAIIFNGTLFNYFELRAESENNGVALNTFRHEEVILNAYKNIGTECLRELDGMYAFCIIDFRYNQIILTRDPFGKKPLYYYDGPDWFAAGSEMKMIMECAIGHSNIKCHYEGLSDYLIFGYNVRNRTLVQNIQKVLAGEVLIASFSGEIVHRWRYWGLPAVNPFFGGNIEEAYSRFKVRFGSAVERQLEAADSQVDILLSGGVDSTAVFCAAAGQGYLPNVFTLRAANNQDCGSYEAEALAALTGVKCSILRAPDPLDPQKLIDTIGEFDEPYCNADAVGMNLLSEFLSDSGRTVALTGDGGNELMIGYNHYREYIRCRAQNDNRWWIPFGDFLHHVPTTQSLILNWAKLYAERFSRIPQWIRKSLLDDSFADLENASVHLIQQTMNDQVGRTAYDFLSRFDYHFGLPDDVLVKVDRTAAHWGVELRTPMIDRDLTAYMVTLPENVRLYYEQEPKWMLRRYIRDYAGDAPWISKVMHRSRHAFCVPPTQALHKIWNQASNWVFEDDFLWWTSLRRYGVEQAMARKGNTNSVSRPGWIIFCLYIWWRKNVANNPIKLPPL